VAGIYIHIPFCKKACTYCNFHFSTSLKYKNELIDALLCEIDMQKNYTSETIDTIYFGGGSPSILEVNDIEKIMSSVRQHFTIGNNIECTLEANPDDITLEKLLGWKAIGINRLSLGIQSFFDEDLLYMNRAHHARHAIQSIDLIHEASFGNFSVDLIFGYPLLTIEKWKYNLDLVIDKKIPHVSCYAMTVEPNTALDYSIKKKLLPPINNDESALHFDYVMNTLQANDYEHYEISSYAQKGKRAIHNSNYWNGQIYLGIGPSAHSFNGVSRQWNVANNTKYITQIQQQILPFEIETLTSTQKLNEYIMIKLRTVEGINKHKLDLKTLNKIELFIQQGLLVEKNNYFSLTQEGKFFADGIAADLFE
jgi:oxygen-independent coproporphyrinogen-3 oxidase